MAIRFDAGYNNQIENIVRNYNKRYKRMDDAGVKHLPGKVSVKELKRRYTNRSDLNRELNRLKNLTRKNVQQKRKIESGLNVFNWEYNYIKSNSKNAKEYFIKEYERVSKRVAKYPGERQYLNNIQAKINLLGKNFKQLEEADFRSTVATINEFAHASTDRANQYRGFLSEVDWVMQQLDYSEVDRNKIFKKFSKLTPSQFLYAYDNNDIIGRIYRLYHKNYGEEEAYLTDTVEKAEELIESFMEQVDDIIKDAQLNAD